MTKKYTDDELINELHRFVKTEGYVPKQRDMCIKNGYISYNSYIRHFKTFNNALTLAGYVINKPSARILTGNETCPICKNKSTDGWYYINNEYICSKCARSDRLYFNGVLDINSNMGFGILGEYLIYKGLQIDKWYNNDINLYNYTYDMYSKIYGQIDVKCSCLHNKNHTNRWDFGIKYNSKLNQNEIPDMYILIGFNNNKSRINHIWLIPSINNNIHKNVFVITDTKNVILKYKKYEIDVNKFNEIYKNLNIHDIYHFRNSPILGDINA